jgi:hypothetical protein
VKTPVSANVSKSSLSDNIESLAELKVSLEDTLAVNADLKGTRLNFLSFSHGNLSEEISAIEGEFYRELSENIVQTKSVS